MGNGGLALRHLTAVTKLVSMFEAKKNCISDTLAGNGWFEEMTLRH
jgi:hypothetical protein